MVAEAAQPMGGLHILVTAGPHQAASATATDRFETVSDEDCCGTSNVK